MHTSLFAPSFPFLPGRHEEFDSIVWNLLWTEVMPETFHATNRSWVSNSSLGKEWSDLGCRVIELVDPPTCSGEKGTKVGSSTVERPEWLLLLPSEPSSVPLQLGTMESVQIPISWTNSEKRCLLPPPWDPHPQLKNLLSWAENRVANRSTCSGPQVRLMALKMLHWGPSLFCLLNAWTKNLLWCLLCLEDVDLPLQTPSKHSLWHLH